MQSMHSLGGISAPKITHNVMTDEGRRGSKINMYFVRAKERVRMKAASSAVYQEGLATTNDAQTRELW